MLHFKANCSSALAHLDTTLKLPKTPDWYGLSNRVRGG
jgi:hypothetical protein